MWWYGSGKSGGSWLPEEKKANMWHGRGNSGGSWPPAFPRSSYISIIFQTLKIKDFRKKCNQGSNVNRYSIFFGFMLNTKRFRRNPKIIKKIKTKEREPNLLAFYIY